MPRLWEKDEFIPEYKRLKLEGLTDKKISEKMFIGKSTLTHYKKEYGVPLTPPNEKKMMSNTNGLTKEMLDEAKKIGLTSNLINARISNCYWSLEEAISIPPLPKGKKLNRGKLSEAHGIL